MKLAKERTIVDFILKHIFEIMVIIIIIALSFTTTGFLSFRNIIGIFRNMSMIGVLAFGITVAIICGVIDLSVPSTVALTGVVIGLSANTLPGLWGIHINLAMLIGLIIMIVVAVCVGLTNAYFVSRFNMPAFIATMAMMYVLFGLAAILSGGFPVIGFPSWYSVVGAGTLFGLIPIPAIVLGVMFIFTYMLMNHTKFGRGVYAVGGNMEAARLSGINIKSVRRRSFIFTQICAVIAGIMLSSQVMSGSFNFATDWAFHAISCVVIGGTAFGGGKGRVWGTFVGLFFYGIVTNAMTLLNLNQFAQHIVRGLLILLAVVINSYRRDE